MSGLQANEFTPLLPAEEHGPHESELQNQNSTSDETQDFLPEQAEQSWHGQSSWRENRQPVASAMLNHANHGSVDEAISSAIDDGYDGELLMRARSRLNSYPVLPDPESIKKKDEQIVHAIEHARSQHNGEEEEVDPGDDPNSKYMRVGPLRFWLVFTTVLLGMCKAMVSKM